jgi:anti-sigma factor RsiW
MDMDCTDFLDRYSDYDDSLLSPAELARFQAHLSVCAACARYDRVLRKGRMLARQRAPVQVGERFAPRLQRRLWQDRTSRRPPAVRVPGGMATALAGVTIVVTALWSVTLLDQELEIGGMAEADAPATPAATASAPPAPAVYLAGWGMLPGSERPPQREWAAHRVDPAVPVAYSPLVTGPPAYRLPATFTASATISTRHSFE